MHSNYTFYFNIDSIFCTPFHIWTRDANQNKNLVFLDKRIREKKRIKISASRHPKNNRDFLTRKTIIDSRKRIRPRLLWWIAGVIRIKLCVENISIKFFAWELLTSRAPLEKTRLVISQTKILTVIFYSENLILTTPTIHLTILHLKNMGTRTLIKKPI